MRVKYNPRDFIGKKLAEGNMRKPSSELKIALICNWHTKCGISTYSSYLYDGLKPLVKDIRVFSEEGITLTAPDEDFVTRCWKRGEGLLPMVKQVLDYKPDYIMIQHEFGIFPNAFYFMQMMQKFENIPYSVTLHSVYEHLDKIVYSSCIKNIVCHTEQGKDILRANGNTNNIHVVPHGCVKFDNVQELWNICHNPYTLMQFGFGFAYKGVDRALDAIHYLKTTDEKFRNIFYIYLISENDYNNRLHLEYYESLMKKVEELNLTENVAIIRKYQTEQMINLHLRLAKLAIFPYLNNPNNTVYAASGAIRIAMANQIPVVASDAHLFDDLDGVVPRPADCIGLAKEIDSIFSDTNYRKGLTEKANAFISRNQWGDTARRYLSVYEEIASKMD
jgi:glycosyltransferase involved in cell wall biosynthesis